MIILNNDEKIYLIKRRHDFVLYSKISPFVLLMTIVLFLILFLLTKNLSWPDFIINFFPFVSNYSFKFFLLFTLSSLLIIFWMIIFFIFMDFYLDYWVITNQRIIKVKINGFFNETSTSVFLSNIQDITTLTRGFIETAFDFGDIYIQTAGAFRELVMDKIPHPEIVKQVIIEARFDAQK